MSYLLGTDIGTSGTKTVLFREDGVVVASSTSFYETYQPKNGWAEQNPLDWWEAFKITVKDVLSKSGIDNSEIKSIGLTGQMHGLVMLNRNGDVLDRSIIWCDQRTAKQCEQITNAVGHDRLIKITANPALTGFTASKILWVRQNKPEIYEECTKILLPKDYIRYMLTGEFATDVSDASGMQLLDVPKRQWSDEVLRKLDLDSYLLADVYESPEITGFLSRRAAEDTGLMEGTIVVGGAGDNAAAAIGTGVISDGSAFTTIGTSGVVYAHTSTPKIDPKGRVHTFCAAVPNEWHVMGVTQAAGLSMKWFRDNFSTDIKYSDMDKMAEEIPIGSENLVFLPYLMGERTPHLDPDCRGVFFGLSNIHTKAHLIRSIMEGVSFSLLDCYSVLKHMNVNISDMMICGGGGKSPFWRQIFADLYRCPVKTIESEEGPALGAAILAGVGAKIFTSIEQGCSLLVKEKEINNPVANNFETYMKYYRIYRGLYASLKDNFKQLKEEN